MATLRRFGGIADSPLGGFLSGLGEGGSDYYAKLLQAKREEEAKNLDFFRSIKEKVARGEIDPATANAMGIGRPIPGAPKGTPPAPVVSPAETEALRRHELEQRGYKASTTPPIAGRKFVTPEGVTTEEFLRQSIDPATGMVTWVPAPEFSQTGTNTQQRVNEAGAVEGAKVGAANAAGATKPRTPQEIAAEQLQRDLEEKRQREESARNAATNQAHLTGIGLTQGGENARAAAERALREKLEMSKEDFKARYAPEMTPQEAAELQKDVADRLKRHGTIPMLIGNILGGNEDIYEQEMVKARVARGLPPIPRQLGTAPGVAPVRLERPVVGPNGERGTAISTDGGKTWRMK